MSKLMFTPVGVAGGLLAGLVSKKMFDFAWSRISEQEPPEPDQREISWGELVAALALQGAIFRVSRGLVERASRVGFYRFTGTWPGEEEPDPA